MRRTDSLSPPLFLFLLDSDDHVICRGQKPALHLSRQFVNAMTQDPITCGHAQSVASYPQAPVETVLQRVATPFEVHPGRGGVEHI